MLNNTAFDAGHLKLDTVMLNHCNRLFLDRFVALALLETGGFDSL